MINKPAYMERGVCIRNHLPNRNGQNKSGNTRYSAGLKQEGMEVSAKHKRLSSSTE